MTQGWRCGTAHEHVAQRCPEEVLSGGGWNALLLDAVDRVQIRNHDNGSPGGSELGLMRDSQKFGCSWIGILNIFKQLVINAIEKKALRCGKSNSRAPATNVMCHGHAFRFRNPSLQVDAKVPTIVRVVGCIWEHAANFHVALQVQHVRPPDHHQVVLRETFNRWRCGTARSSISDELGPDWVDFLHADASSIAHLCYKRPQRLSHPRHDKLLLLSEH